MADDTNIDEILKSIDALLKDSEDDTARNGDDKRHRQATNDEEISPDIEAEAAALSDGDLEVRSVEEHQVEQELTEQRELEQHQAELQQAGDAADMDDRPTNFTLAEGADGGAGQDNEKVQDDAKTSVSRILLSEAMVVEDTPALPLMMAGSETASDEDQAANRMPGDIDSDGADPDHVTTDENEDDANKPEEFQGPVGSFSPVLSEHEEKGKPSSEASELDMSALIEQITAEISARLQQQLPGMVAGMVAEAMEKNLTAHVSADDESTDDQ